MTLEEYIELIEIKIKITKKTLKKIDELIKKGLFLSRKQFIKAAIAETLQRYHAYGE